MLWGDGRPLRPCVETLAQSSEGSPSLSFQRLLTKLQSWERLDQTTGLSIR